MADLSERIVAVLSEPTSAKDAAVVLAAAEREYIGLEAQADALDLKSLSPSITLTEAHELRGQATDTRFLADRLDASLSALRARVEDLRAAERAAERKAKINAAITARDATAAAISEQYPRLVRELTALAKQICDTEALCRNAGIEADAEYRGRGLDGRTPMSRTIIGSPVVMPKSSASSWEMQGGQWVWSGLNA